MIYRLIIICNCIIKSKDIVIKILLNSNFFYINFLESFILLCMYKDKNRICWNKFLLLNVCVLIYLLN